MGLFAWYHCSVGESGRSTKSDRHSLWSILCHLSGLGKFCLGSLGENVAPMFNLAFNALPAMISKFLEAYPLTIISVYPIVGITLRNNLLTATGFGPPIAGNY